MSQKVMYGGRKRVVHTGAKGGKYVVVNGGKKYLKSKNVKKVKKVNKKVNKGNSFFRGGWGPTMLREDDE